MALSQNLFPLSPGKKKRMKNDEIEKCFCEVAEIANVKIDLCYNDLENVHNWHLRRVMTLIILSQTNRHCDVKFCSSAITYDP